MEAMKMTVAAYMLVVLVALSAFNGASAAEAPAPAPTSAAPVAAIPACLASIVAMAFALLF